MSFNIDLKSYGNKLLSFGIYANVMSERTKACFPRDRTLRTLVISPKMGWARERSKRPIVQAQLLSCSALNSSIRQRSLETRWDSPRVPRIHHLFSEPCPTLRDSNFLACTLHFEFGQFTRNTPPYGTTKRTYEHTWIISLSLSLCSHPRAQETSYYITKSQMQVLTLFYSLMFKLYPLWKLRRSLEIFGWFVQMLSNSVFANLLLSP